MKEINPETKKISLTYKTEEEMIKIRNLGRKSLDEVKNKLAEMGLGFAPSEE